MLQIEKGQDIKQELLQRYKTILPDELIEIWEDNGLARLLGGYLKVVNPEDYQELLKETYYRGNISVPILVTAFGDIVTFEDCIPDLDKTQKEFANYVLMETIRIKRIAL